MGSGTEWRLSEPPLRNLPVRFRLHSSPEPQNNSCLLWAQSRQTVFSPWRRENDEANFSLQASVFATLV